MADSGSKDVAEWPDEHDHLERAVRIGIAWKLASQLGIQIVRFGVVAVLARLLRPEEYGTAAVAVTLAAFASTLGDMGMGSALVQTKEAPRRVSSTAFWGAVAYGVGLTVLLMAISGPVASYMQDPVIGTMISVSALTFTAYAIGSTSQAMFMRAMNFRALELRYMLALVIAGVTAVAAALSGLGAWSLIIQQVVLAVAFVAFLQWRVHWHPTPEFSWPDFRRLSGFAVRIAGGRWARLAELVVVSVLIGHFVGVSELGLWTFAFSTVVLPLTFIAIPIVEVVFSAFSRMQGQRERVAGLWIRGIGILAAIILPLLVGFAVVAKELVPLVFGDQWSSAVPVMQVLSIYVIIRCLQSWNSIILDAAGKPHVTFWTQLAALCLAPIAVVVGSNWGIEAVAALFVLCQLVAVEIPSFVAVVSELRVSALRVAPPLLRVTAATLVMAVACLACRMALEHVAGPLVVVVATVAVGIAVYLPVLSVLAPDIRREVVQLVASRLRGRRGEQARSAHV